MSRPKRFHRGSLPTIAQALVASGPNTFRIKRRVHDTDTSVLAHETPDGNKRGRILAFDDDRPASTEKKVKYVSPLV